MNKNLRGALSVLLLYGLLASNAHATGGMVLYGGLTFGGDTLATAYYEDGDDADLDAGGLFHLAMGYEKRFEEGGVRVTFGYKFDQLNADNGSADITRFPLEAVIYKSFGEDLQHNFGGGLVYEMSPEFDISGSSGITFDDATGFMVYYGHSSGGVFEWGLRYTSIDYETDFLQPIDASNFGFYVSSFYE